MSYDLFTDEHDKFRTIIREFIKNEMDPNSIEWEEKGFPKQVVKTLADEGVFGLKFPKEIGGGHDAVMSGVFIEELARCQMGGLTAGVLMHSEVVLELLFRLANKDQQAKYLTPGIAGEKFGALAFGDPASLFDISSNQTTAAPKGDGYIINGKKSAVLNGSLADFIIITAKNIQDGNGAGITTFIVDADAKGLEKFPVRQFGYRSGDMADLVFEDLVLSADNVLGTPGSAVAEMKKTFEWMYIALALYSSSSSWEAWRRSVKYAEERQADGRPLIKHKAISFDLADSIAKIMASTELAHDCMWKRLRDIPCEFDALSAKLYSTRSMQNIAETALKVFGDEGLLEGHEAGRFMRDARIFAGQAGGTELQMEQMADLLGL